MGWRETLAWGFIFSPKKALKLLNSRETSRKEEVRKATENEASPWEDKNRRDSGHRGGGGVRCPHPPGLDSG